MPSFSYLAKDPKGEERRGTIEAEDTHQLARVLKEQGFLLIKAEAQKEKEEKRGVGISFSRPISLADKMMFTRNLQVMIASGLPLPKALETLSYQSKSKAFTRAILEIKEMIIKGTSFSDALSLFPNIFSELFQNMIRVGEEAGNLDEVLQVVAQQMEREHDLKSKIQGALMYPAVIILAMVGIGILMLVMVVPKLAETFEELGVELPLTTRAVIFLGTFLAEKWYLFILIIIAFIVLLRLASKKREGKRIIDTLLLKLPIVSNLVKKTNSAATVRTLSSLIKAGVPIVRALSIVAGTLGNIYYREALGEAAEKVKKGEKLSEVLRPYKALYPFIVFQMVEVGEETGETAKLLAKLADFFEEEIGNETKNIVSVIEPVLMIIIGATVGFFAISMVQPMYSMLGAI